MIKYRIGIVDEEKSFRYRFINFFDGSDFEVIEISKLSSFRELIDIIILNKLDAVVIDYKLKEKAGQFLENGDSLFAKLINSIPNFPSFILTAHSGNAKKQSKKINPLLIIDKSKIDSSNTDNKKEFIEELTAIIDVYKSDIDEKEKRLASLSNLKNKGKLTDKLENEYLDLFIQLSKAHTGETAFPVMLLSQEISESMTDVIESTNELIKQIKDAQLKEGLQLKKKAKHK